jgi:KamA family protein
MKVCYITNIRKLEGLTDKECRRLLPVTEQYAFRINDYYYNLINWDDPKDPLRRLVIPSEDELNPTVGKLDACNEASYTPVRGCQHKYSDTAILLVNEVCGAYCRYCFRKRLFMNDNNDATLNCEEGLEYIAEHEEITNVLLTGGDPLIMSTGRLEPIINAAASIPHVRIIRIGTKMAAFNPHRIVDDMSLLRLIKEYCNKQTQIYIVNHFDHPREVTPTAQEAIRRLRKVGAQTLNQCPIVRGVNDDARTLGSLFRELSFMGCPQYYVFQGRPVESNESYTVPIVKGLN